jgi:hypothetical protein
MAHPHELYRYDEPHMPPSRRGRIPPDEVGMRRGMHPEELSYPGLENQHIRK